MTLWLPKARYGKNNLDGPHEHLISRDWRTGKLLTFTTRKTCREWIKQEMGYIKHRTDLRMAPHHWLLPVPVRVKIVEIKDDATRIRRHKPASRVPSVRQLRAHWGPRPMARSDPDAS